MSLDCGDFCVESAIILANLGASRCIERQHTKMPWALVGRTKALKMKDVLGDTEEPLLISGLEVRVLPGSPLLFNKSSSGASAL